MNNYKKTLCLSLLLAAPLALRASEAPDLSATIAIQAADQATQIAITKIKSKIENFKAQQDGLAEHDALIQRYRLEAEKELRRLESSQVPRQEMPQKNHTVANEWSWWPFNG